jgi:hypothetical protein
MPNSVPSGGCDGQVMVIEDVTVEDVTDEDVRNDQIDNLEVVGDL